MFDNSVPGCNLYLNSAIVATVFKYREKKHQSSKFWNKWPV